jgi:hypothetical protein
MSTLKFNDGVEFNTSGEHRIERRYDGLYVVGNGLLAAVDSYDEGYKLIDDLKGAGERSNDDTK